MLQIHDVMQGNKFLPPLNSLKSFLRTAEFGTTTSAGDSLSRSHGAVSRQIKILEDWFGVALFTRDGGRLVLTTAGKQYQEGVARAFSLLERASLDLKSLNATQPIRIACPPAFSKRWLLPRLTTFLERHPTIDVQLVRHLEGGVLPNSDYDLAIFMNPPSGQHLDVDPLMSDLLVPIRRKSSKLARKNTRVLIRSSDTLASWENWMKDRPRAQDAYRFFYIDDIDVAISATLQGGGTMIGRAQLIASELDSGELDLDDNVALQIDVAYWVAAPMTSNRHPGMRALRSFLKTEGLIAVEKIKTRMPMLTTRHLQDGRIF